ncbi:hypothetical protein GFS24_20130 [Chitinophaga sp. SYP-B3965]|uniref:TapB family protein n=1 Tax=Chitinophaga sp. SYP-B3965 TaxID=2663120 RepID=UPI001299A160|nr:hypothetical protein [Chitinophaga sp. SYP-B3965]MRG47440.1 hypothetical protein [Chitinophaga sp. SYP-B3965]
MKCLWITTTFLLFAALAATAQDCKSFYYMTDNAVVEMSIYNEKEELMGKQLYKIAEVEKKGSDLVSTFTTSFMDKNGKEVSKSEGKFKCNGVTIGVDMKMNIPGGGPAQSMNAKVKASDSYLAYPTTMRVGQYLADGAFKMESEMNGMPMVMDFKISERKVEAKESITTTAGTWECFKISYNIEMKVSVMGAGVPMDLKATEWFAPGFGMVKSMSYNKNGKLMGSMAITKLEK